MKHLIATILALSIYDIQGKPEFVKVEVETENGKYEKVLKKKELETSEGEIYRWLETLK